MLFVRNRHEPTLLDAGTDKCLLWTQIVCEGGHTPAAALTKNDKVYAWVSNGYGQVVGRGGKESKRVPIKVVGLDGLVVIQLSCSA